MKKILIITALLFITKELVSLGVCTENTVEYQISGCSTQSRTCCMLNWCDWSSSVQSCASCSALSETRNCKNNVLNTTGGTQSRYKFATNICGSCTYSSEWTEWDGTCTCRGTMVWNDPQQKCVFGSITPSGYTWTCSLGTLAGGVAYTGCKGKLNWPYWPDGDSCGTKDKICKGVMGDEESTPYYCTCG